MGISYQCPSVRLPEVQGRFLSVCVTCDDGRSNFPPPSGQSVIELRSQLAIHSTETWNERPAGRLADYWLAGRLGAVSSCCLLYPRSQPV